MILENKSICVIGAGKLGLSFADYFVKNSDFNTKNSDFKLIARSDYSYSNANKILNKKYILRDISEMKIPSDIFILTVRDGEIKQLSEYLAQIYNINLKNKYIIHCSGMLSSDELIACKNFSAKVISLHPYQTFYFPKAENFYNIYWGIEGDIDSLILELIKFLRGNSLEIEKKNKILYHISAVAMSNYLNSTITLGRLTGNKAGINSNKFATPIINSTVNNVLNSEDNSKTTLTGPIMRADLNTIKAHISAIEADESLLKPYCYFGLATLELAKSTKQISEEVYKSIKNLFNEYI